MGTDSGWNRYDTVAWKFEGGSSFVWSSKNTRRPLTPYRCFMGEMTWHGLGRDLGLELGSLPNQCMYVWVGFHDRSALNKRLFF